MTPQNSDSSTDGESPTDDGAKPALVVVLSVDLIDRSKVSAAFPGAVLVRSVGKLIDTAVADALVLVDLARIANMSDLEKLPGRLVGFGSHVDDERLAAAEAAGVEAVPRSVFFRRLENGDF